MKAIEANFDGLVGPTHNYSGLSFGNIASDVNRNYPSNPKQAAKQGLSKMKLLMDMGLVQGVFPPQERPDIYTLKTLGFSGSEGQILARAANQAPGLLAACSSASSMWAANAATVSPSPDSEDQRVHFSTANLLSNIHRAIETATTERILRACFADPRHFVHHPPLPAATQLSDEGAANHNRLCNDYGDPGVQLFAYGSDDFNSGVSSPQLFPARQSYQASCAIARRHRLDPSKVVFAQQNPAAIDQGVFHNDVIAVCNRNLLFCHQRAFVDQPQLYQTLSEKMTAELQIIEVKDQQLSIEKAVSSYLFNSQLISLDEHRMCLIVPQECQHDSEVKNILDQLIDGDNPIDTYQALDLKQSMRNGGGPACLRLRVVLSKPQLAAVNSGIILNNTLYAQLNNWIDRHYRDRLSDADLADPQLLFESRVALDELTQLLNLGAIYKFQKTLM
ncbi:MAG: N-succinylarginine dihydrolase [Motiliproteus sp.]